MTSFAWFAALVATTAVTGCQDLDGDGEWDCLGAECDTGETTPRDITMIGTWGPVALGGTVTLEGRSQSESAITVEATPEVLVNVIGGGVGAKKVEVTGLREGQATVAFSTPTDRFPAQVLVKRGDRFALALGSAALPQAAPDVFVVPANASDVERTVTFTLFAADGTTLRDDSLVLATDSASAVTRAERNQLLLPAEPGTYDVVFDSKSLGRQPRPLRIVDHVDGIVAERVDGDATHGLVCFYGVAGDDLAIAATWTYTASGATLTGSNQLNCRRYAASAGEAPQIEVTVGGFTQTFALDAI